MAIADIFRLLFTDLTPVHKSLLLIFFLTVCCKNTKAEWVEYSTRTNGDIYFFDNTRVQMNSSLRNVWIRIKYKSSVMGAKSYQSLIRIDCSEYTETTLQNTFYTDNNWTTPAMETNIIEKQKGYISADSTTKRLTDLLCNWLHARFLEVRSRLGSIFV